MTSAWIISSGSYSYYRVSAVFLDREEAEAYVERWNASYELTGDSQYGVEEMPLCPLLPEPGTVCFNVYITRKGDIISCDRSEYTARNPTSHAISHGYAGPGWSVACFASDAGAARKIASEYRQAELAKEAMSGIAHPCVGNIVGVPPNSDGDAG